MRTIKFRAKRVYNGEFIFGCYQKLVVFGTMRHFILPDDGIIFSDALLRDVLIEVIPETVGQYVCDIPNTSMYVDNSQPIFEGDVFKQERTTTKYEVVFINNRFIGISNEGDKYGSFTFPLTMEELKNTPIEIIGNIHDNPELLK